METLILLNLFLFLKLYYKITNNSHFFLRWIKYMLLLQKKNRIISFFIRFIYFFQSLIFMKKNNINDRFFKKVKMMFKLICCLTLRFVLKIKLYYPLIR